MTVFSLKKAQAKHTWLLYTAIIFCSSPSEARMQKSMNACISCMYTVV